MKIIISALSIILFALPLMVKGDMGMMGSSGMMGSFGYGIGALVMLSIIVWLIVGVLVAVWLWKQITNK